jgi:hypothetical protein
LGHIVGEDKKIGIEPFAYNISQTWNASCILGDVVGDKKGTNEMGLTRLGAALDAMQIKSKQLEIN